ncbi:Cysteine desulfurase IscS [Candidatus Providencia siddallii]|uniref:cysteine desulfurase n=1 Tax=Candidatus Providencia siddallii TaxID=1715285 RepID=A0ABM9NPX3_9GAMM
MKLPIYFDYSATTPVDSRVAKKMMKYLTIDGIFGNPSSRSHRFGWEAEEAVDIARNQVAELINSDSSEIIFTSGATESNNLAIKGAAKFYQKKGIHIITNKIEHKSVLDTCLQLENEGFEITYLSTEYNGIIPIKKIENAIKKNTILISIMHVNNEIGIIQNIEEIGKICRNNGIIFHVDATQSIGKIPVDIKLLKIDLMSFSAHKIYGPMGIGVLYVRRNPSVYICAQQHGGGHEYGMRSGTLAVHQIVGIGEACNILKKEILKEYKRLNNLRLRLLKGIKDIKGIFINTDFKHSAPHILNISFENVENELLLILLKDLAVSSGSACNSNNLESSYVLRSLGISNKLAHNSIRFSIGRFTKKKEINYAIKLINDVIEKIKF